MCLVNSPHVLNSESSERGLARVLEEMYMCVMQNLQEQVFVVQKTSNIVRKTR